MKRIVLSLTIMLVAFSSCTTTNESKVEREFEKYVYNNFDDPKSVKEVISIELVKHTNTDSLRSLIMTLNDLIEKQYSDDSTIVEKCTRTKFIDKMVKNASMLKGITRYKYTSSFDKWGEFLNNHYFDYLSLRSQNKRILSNDSILKPFDVSVYKIKFRQINDGNLELKEYYSIIDNLKEKDNITIQLTNLTDDQHPEWFIYCGENCGKMIKIKDEFSNVREDLYEAYLNIKIELEEKDIFI